VNAKGQEAENGVMEYFCYKTATRNQEREWSRSCGITAIEGLGGGGVGKWRVFNPWVWVAGLGPNPK
jgi:hypothetical protein